MRVIGQTAICHFFCLPLFPDIAVGTYAWMGGSTEGCSLGSMEIDYILESTLLVFTEVVITPYSCALGALALGLWP